jgi:hypothetical protein
MVRLLYDYTIRLFVWLRCAYVLNAAQAAPVSELLAYDVGEITASQRPLEYAAKQRRKRPVASDASLSLLAACGAQNLNPPVGRQSGRWPAIVWRIASSRKDLPAGKFSQTN